MVLHDLSLTFFNYGFKFQCSICNGFHDLSTLCINRNNVAAITIKNVNYPCIIHDISNF